MSRSRRKNPVAGVTSTESEKQDKRLANRAVRRRVKQTLAADPSAPVLPVKREASNVWTMDKDGKQRFDPAQAPQRMRK